MFDDGSKQRLFVFSFFESILLLVHVLGVVQVQDVLQNFHFNLIISPLTEQLLP